MTETSDMTRQRLQDLLFQELVVTYDNAVLAGATREALRATLQRRLRLVRGDDPDPTADLQGNT